MQAKEVLGQSSYLSVNDRRLHFGLGAAKSVNIEVRWPLGLVENFGGVSVDQVVHITEGRGITRYEKFKVT